MSIFHSIDEAIVDFREGKPLIVVDDEDRQNAGDFIIVAEKITPKSITFLMNQGRGLICLALLPERAEALKLTPMVERNTSPFGISFTVSIDAKGKVAKGSSAKDRAHTILVTIDPHTKPEDLVRPGHVFPILAKNGGVLKRAGHTEAAVDMARLAGLNPAGVLCEIMDEEGNIATLPTLWKLAEKFGIKIISIRDLIHYRRKTEIHVKREEVVDFPSKFGKFKLYMYSNDLDNSHHLALVKGTINPEEEILVRVHSECLTGDVLGSLRCDCGDQLSNALRRIEENKRGVLLYMRQEGRGIGLANKIHAYRLQDEGKDTVEANEVLGFSADLRDYGIGAQTLVDLGVRKIALLTNNLRKVVGLEGYGLTINRRVPIEIQPNEANKKYLQTKRDKLGHLILENDKHKRN